MACPLYLQRGHRCRCLAVVGDLVVPTVYQREAYCSTGSSVTCPTFVARGRKGSALSEDEYLTQWCGDGQPGR